MSNARERVNLFRPMLSITHAETGDGEDRLFGKWKEISVA